MPNDDERSGPGVAGSESAAGAAAERPAAAGPHADDPHADDAERFGRAYRGAELTVRFEARRCIHVRACVRGLPAVFDVARRPWIAPDAAAADAVVRAVERCPSGALTYAWTDGRRGEAPAAVTNVEPEPGGPLHVRGDLVIATADGPRRTTRATLCACGRSANAPFCDGSHRSAATDP